MKWNRKLLRDKKGVNDISIVTGILAIFILTAITIPYINAGFTTSYAEYDVDAQKGTIRDQAESTSQLSVFSVLLTILKLGVWDFGDTLALPVYIDAFFTLLAIVFILTIARNIWIGGGA